MTAENGVALNPNARDAYASMRPRPMTAENGVDTNTFGSVAALQ